uniref:Uncharacterized protein LOC114344888 n=1 Tax=Diabrotica virgifera virgifera TaxID=50390 RepID=A0A6P7GNN3_DIAVI
MPTLKVRRSNCEESFSKIFTEVKDLADELDVKVKLPRFVVRPEEYYRHSIYIPLLDNVFINLTSRLHITSLECLWLRGIIPTLLTDSQGEKEVDLLKDLKRVVENFSPIMDIGDTQTNIILLPDEVTKLLDVCYANVFMTFKVLYEKCFKCTILTLIF